MGNGGIVPPIFHLGTRLGEWSPSPSGSFIYGAWVPGNHFVGSWTGARARRDASEKRWSISFYRKSTRDSLIGQARSLLTIPNWLLWLLPWSKRLQSLSGSSPLCVITIPNIKRYQVGESKHNTLLRCRCHRVDDMFRPFTIRPSSGLTRWKLKRKLQCYILPIYIVYRHLVRPDDGLKVRPHRTRSAAADCGLCPLRNVTF